MRIQLRTVAKSFYQSDVELKILNNLDLEIKEGEVVAVVGESGSGKSTLLSLLAGFVQPDLGEMLWNGSSTKAWSEKQWSDFRKTNLGFVFQDYHLIPYLTALENVALPLRLQHKPDPEKPASQLLEQLGLGQRYHHLPAQLSGGECQRVAIGRAILHHPQLVLADEPTGSLDAKTGAQVLSLFFGLLKDTKQTALIVTHSHEVAGRCDRVLSLREGRLWPT